MNIVVIKSNYFENVPKKKMNSALNEYLKKYVRGNDYFVDGEKIIVNKFSVGKLTYGKTLFDRRIEKNIRNELKANIIVNINEIIENSVIYQKNRKDNKDHNFADTFNRRKAIILYKDIKYKIMFEVGKKDGKNTLYGIEHIKK